MEQGAWIGARMAATDFSEPPLTCLCPMPNRPFTQIDVFTDRIKRGIAALADAVRSHLTR